MVAHASNSHANGKSPAHNAFQMFFGGLESFGQAYDPFFKGLARTQLEVLGFANRRAQAYMQIPASAAQCRTPQDLFNLQTQFWRAAYEDYTRERGARDQRARGLRAAEPCGADRRGAQQRTRLHRLP